MLPSDLLCMKLNFSKTELFLYANTCPKRYKVYKIKKRNSTKKRTIAQPSKNLKVVQKLLIEHYFQDRLPIHERATAYKKGSSILKNATYHLRNKFLLKMDFKSFFPSISAKAWEQFIIDEGILPAEEAEEIRLVSNIFFREVNSSLELSIGAPSSPFISNTLMYKFDDIVHKKAETEKIAYSRYSDDMTLSTNIKNKLFDWPNIIEEISRELEYPKLLINEKKTVFSSKKHNRHVTGVTITNDGKASLGRAKKREIRTRVYLTAENELSNKERDKLVGILSHAKNIEPYFVKQLYEKYPEQMNSLFVQK